MTNYIIRRLFWVIPTLLLVTILIFSIIRLIPGDIIDVIMSEMGESAAEFTRADLEHTLGLDVPIHLQYVRWIGNLVTHGDLGESLRMNTPVTQEIMCRIPVTIELAILALLVAILIAFPIGVYSAIRQDTVSDYIGRSVAIIMIALPSFWIGTMVMVFPSIWWQWAPPMSYINFFKDPADNLLQFIIPGTILGMSLCGVNMRMIRTMLLEVLRQDYIRTAWSKGLKERVIVVRHALKNALMPVITLMGVQLPFLIGGTVIIEQIFVLPGIGRLFVEAAFQRDYPIITGTVLFFAVAVLLVNLLIDLTYGFVDPRVQYK